MEERIQGGERCPFDFRGVLFYGVLRSWSREREGRLKERGRDWRKWGKGGKTQRHWHRDIAMWGGRESHRLMYWWGHWSPSIYQWVSCFLKLSKVFWTSICGMENKNFVYAGTIGYLRTQGFMFWTTIICSMCGVDNKNFVFVACHAISTESMLNRILCV